MKEGAVKARLEQPTVCEIQEQAKYEEGIFQISKPRESVPRGYVQNRHERGDQQGYRQSGHNLECHVHHARRLSDGEQTTQESQDAANDAGRKDSSARTISHKLGANRVAAGRDS